MTTKDKIIETAVALFNEQGTAAVSTNHIAAACNISPGNLYYHFRNKADIIRAIFQQMTQVGVDEYGAIIMQYPPGTAESMEQTFLMIQQFNWRYRFFKRELTALVMADPQLQEQFQATNRLMQQMIRQSIEAGIAAGRTKPLDEQEKAHFVDAVWLLALFWVNYLEVGGEEVNEANLARGNELLRLLIRPYLTGAAP
ncbi:TetR/AcrR family transcriptional regulator [Trichlorobacter lovleyi]|uniref:TetR/AcrR family transcriptional regulator n=1 Tax=Trichlorobacter lovleyi TaxID=313985 RepID=UPI0024812772|nr:TetR/AcrR family transcriptional regulator [Trichlorobacter lovleyi]